MLEYKNENRFRFVSLVNLVKKKKLNDFLGFVFDVDSDIFVFSNILENVLSSEESLCRVISVIFGNIFIKNVLVMEFVFEIDRMRVEIKDLYC